MDQVSLLFLLFQAFLLPGLVQNDPVEEASLMERRIPKIEQLSLLAATVSQKKFKQFFILDSCLSA
jgi:hypothetical protein